MSKYIDSEKLIAEIERRLKIVEPHKDTFESAAACRQELIWMKGFIKSLQQEQPDNWNDEYQEDELLIRFAFYTYKDEDSVLYLSNVFVEETSRNKGFGTKILQAAEKVAETIGAITIRLKVKRNSQANDWYRKHGYGYLTFEGEYDWLEKNLEYLKPKQEQPGVDLEKEFGRWMDKLDDKYCILVEDYSIQDIKDTARHFYELGQCTKYQQDRAEFAKLKAKEWQEGYDEGYAKGLNARKEE